MFAGWKSNERDVCDNQISIWCFILYQKPSKMTPLFIVEIVSRGKLLVSSLTGDISHALRVICSLLLHVCTLLQCGL